jgi:hypothetical protein
VQSQATLLLPCWCCLQAYSWSAPRGLPLGTRPEAGDTIQSHLQVVGVSLNCSAHLSGKFIHLLPRVRTVLPAHCLCVRVEEERTSVREVHTLVTTCKDCPACTLPVCSQRSLLVTARLGWHHVMYGMISMQMSVSKIIRGAPGHVYWNIGACL